MKKMKLFFAFILILSIGVISLMTNTSDAAPKRSPGTYAIFDTTHGTFVVKLMPEVAPQTVENFIGLANGTKEFTDPLTSEKVKRPFYDGLVFHRIIPKFMIQGGDPLGNGSGGPGYKFADEFDGHPGFTKKGLLAMANSGPDTNGSQFFITTVPTQHLNPTKDNYGQMRGHTIFGDIIEGYDVVEKIEKVKTGGGNVPLEPVVMKTVKILEVK